MGNGRIAQELDPIEKATVWAAGAPLKQQRLIWPGETNLPLIRGVSALVLRALLCGNGGAVQYDEKVEGKKNGELNFWVSGIELARRGFDSKYESSILMVRILIWRHDEFDFSIWKN